ncbi:hypothetical protein DL95DRAFT_449485 [Leptodontidium sp. 2 PMI_412]|nr:hypothetical protein DL95DRAFT_449485 [Leptodontidium sp. 2 PMI_412]
MEQRETLSLIPPPLGVTSNFENPKYIGDIVIVSNLVLLVLSTLVFLTRIYTRRVVVQSVDFGDYALAVGWGQRMGWEFMHGICPLLGSVSSPNCRPIAKAWDLSITTGSCSGALEMCVTNSTANAAVDIAMLILPIAMLWNVRMAKRDKIGAVAILMTGSLESYPMEMQSAVEVHVGVICACLPHMKPLLRRHFPKMFESSSQGDTPMELPSLESLSQHGIRGE